MKQYQLLADSFGFKSGTIFEGPYDILGQQSKGYYPQSELQNRPSHMCLFASAVEGNTELFKLLPDEKKA
jgi:hypothetical protein